MILLHGNKPWLRLYPFNPRADIRKIVDRETAFVRDVGVGEESDIGDGVIAD
jgi:hypothetical protein